MEKRTGLRRLLAGLLCLVMVLSLFEGVGLLQTTARAADVPMPISATHGSVSRVADELTMDQYIDALLGGTRQDGTFVSNGSRSAGRLWVDKSVIANESGSGISLPLDVNTDGVNKSVTTNEDFLHIYSVLGSTQKWSVTPPSAVTIVIDNSGSMYANVTTGDNVDGSANTTVPPIPSKPTAGGLWTETRIEQTVAAVNTAIDKLMKDDDNNMVSVVLFGNGSNSRQKGEEVTGSGSDTAVTIIPMGHYEVSDTDTPLEYLSARWTRDTEDTGAGRTPEGIPKESTRRGSGSGEQSCGGGYVFVDWQALLGEEAFKTSSDHKDHQYDYFNNGTTNIQAGIYQGFQELLKMEPKQISIGGVGNGVKLSYVPTLVVLTDGVATDGVKAPWNEIASEGMERTGFLNDFSDKRTSFTGRNASGNCNWDQFAEKIPEEEQSQEKYSKNGDEWRTLAQAQNTPYSESRYDLDTSNSGNLKTMQTLGTQYRHGQEYMLLSTLMTASYMKSAVENAYGLSSDSSCGVFTISVDMPDTNDSDFTAGTGNTEEDAKVTSNGPTMNPTVCFNEKWLSKYANAAELYKGQENDGEYSVGNLTYLGLKDALDHWNAISGGTENSVSLTYRPILSGGSLLNSKGEKVKPYAETVGGTQYEPTHNTNDGYWAVYDAVGLTIPGLSVLADDVNKVTAEQMKDNILYVPRGNAYYAQSGAEAESQITKVFETIIGRVTADVFAPVGGTNALDAEDSVTYRDPIGQYMEVKTVNNISLFGKLYTEVKTAVYDYQWNSDYMTAQEDAGGIFTSGWYSGATGAEGEKKELGTGGVTTSKQAWEAGWVYRLDFSTAQEFVPTLKSTGTVEGLSETQKHTVYTMYRLGTDTDDERNDLRMNPAYGDSVPGGTNDANYRNTPGVYKLSDIRVWVEDTGNWRAEGDVLSPDLDYQEALCVDVPVNVIPLQVATIGFDAAKENAISYSTNLIDTKNSTPLRVFYSVGLENTVKHNSGDIDLSQVTQEYMDRFRGSDSKIYFLSNHYSGSTYEGLVTDNMGGDSSTMTRGNPAVTFSPSSQNRYYVFQQPQAVYWAADGGTEEPRELVLDNEKSKQFQGLTADGDVDPKYKYVTEVGNEKGKMNSEDWYYIVVDYYEAAPEGGGKGVYKQVAVPRQGKEFGSGLGAEETLDAGEYLCWFDANGTTEATHAFSTERPGTTELGENWILGTRKGGLRTGNMGQSIGVKGSDIGADYVAERYTSANKTATAGRYYLPTVSSATKAEDIVLDIFLGNNGRMSVEDTLVLVTKTVKANSPNPVNPNEEFDFQLFAADMKGDVNAIVVQKDQYVNLWRRCISTIDVVTGNQGYLQLANTTDAAIVEDYEFIDKTSEKKVSGNWYVYLGKLDTVAANTVRVYSASENKTDDPVGGFTTYVPADQLNAAKLNETDTMLYEAADPDHGYPAGTRVFWCEAYLRDVETIPPSPGTDRPTDDQLDNFKIDQHFPIAIMRMDQDAGLRSGVTLESPYSISSTFLTRTISFGLGSKDDLFDKNSFQNPRKNDTFTSHEYTASEIYPYTAQFTLHDGEGLLVNGIPNLASFRVTERLTQEQLDQGYTLGNVRLVQNKNYVDYALADEKQASRPNNPDHGTTNPGYAKWTAYKAFQIGDNGYIYDIKDVTSPDHPNNAAYFDKDGHYYSVYGDTSNLEKAAHFTNTFEPQALTIEKVLEAAEGVTLTAEDRNKDFEFTADFYFLKGPGDKVEWIFPVTRYRADGTTYPATGAITRSVAEAAAYAYEDPSYEGQPFDYASLFAGLEPGEEPPFDVASDFEMIQSPDGGISLLALEAPAVITGYMKLTGTAEGGALRAQFGIVKDGKLVWGTEAGLLDEGFRLKGGEKLVIYGLPKSAYRVVVKETAQGGFTVEPEAGCDREITNGSDESLKLLTFTNTKQPTDPVTVTLNVTKQVTVEAAPPAQVTLTFKFHLVPDAGNPEGDPVSADGVTGTATVNIETTGGPFTSSATLLDSVEYKVPGVYYYTLSEENDLQSGVKYDANSTHRIKVTVTEVAATKDKNAYLMATMEDVDAAGDGHSVTLTETSANYDSDTHTYTATFSKFTNTYKEGTVNVVLEGLKRLIGGELEAGKFTFVLTPLASSKDDPPPAGDEPESSPDMEIISGADATSSPEPDDPEASDEPEATAEPEATEEPVPVATAEPEVDPSPVDGPSMSAVEGGDPIPEQPGDPGVPGPETEDDTPDDETVTPPTEATEEPAEPTETPEPSAEPTETPAEPTETPAEPSETPAEPSETPADPTETPTESAEPSATPEADDPAGDEEPEPEDKPAPIAEISPEEVPMPEGAENIGQPTVRATATNDASGVFRFGNIEFTEPGTYNYQIMEVLPPDGPYVQDAQSVPGFKVKVVVEEVAGELKATVTYYRNDAPGAALDEGTQVTAAEVVFTNIDTKPHKTEPVPGPDEPVGVGETITYRVTWYNDSKLLDQDEYFVYVRDRLDPGVTYIEGTAKAFRGEAPAEAPTTSTTAFIVNGELSTTADGVNTLNWKIPSTGPGDYGYVEFQVTVNENAKFTWDYTSGREPQTGQPDAPNGDPDVDKDTEDWILHNQAGVSIDNEHWDWTEEIDNPLKPEKSSNPASGNSVKVGDTITYRITWRNYYDNQPAVVKVTDILDFGVTYKAGTAKAYTGDYPNGKDMSKDGTYDEASRTLTWDLGEQEAGANGYVEFQAKVNENAPLMDGLVKNKATVIVDHQPNVTNEVKHPLSGALTVTKYVTGDDADPEKDFTFTVTLTAPTTEEQRAAWDDWDGTCAYTRSDVEGANSLTFTKSGDGGTATSGTFTLHDQQSVTITGLPLGARYTVTESDSSGYSVSATDQTGSIISEGAEAVFTNTKSTRTPPPGNTPSPSPSPTPTPSTSPEPSTSPTPTPSTTPIPSPTPGGGPHKIETDPGDGKLVIPDQWITYTIFWENYRSETATVTIRDPLDPNVAFESASSPGVYDRATHTVTWELGEKPAGDYGTVTLTVRVLPSAVEAGIVKNQAHVKVNGDPWQDTEIPENPLKPKPTPVPTPPSGIPDTGDGSHPGRWLGLMTASLAGLWGLSGAFLRRRKRRKAK